LPPPLINTRLLPDVWVETISRIAADFLSLRERTEVRVNGIVRRQRHERLLNTERQKATLILTFSLREKEPDHLNKSPSNLDCVFMLSPSP
jgi:hypothetical protein